VRLVAAPDKFRGTLSAPQAAAAIAAAAHHLGHEVSARPMSDGGEGFAEAVGGAIRTQRVRGPLGTAVDASWRIGGDGTAVIESAAAAGRALLTDPRNSEPVDASTYGVGELIAAAISAGASRVVVGCGGTATTDGGMGCIEALDELGVDVTVPLVVACDVQSAFRDAAPLFAPQKGATPAQVAILCSRLGELADDYRRRFGVDVGVVPGSGAGGGLAGGLVALGARIVSGAEFVAASNGLAGDLDGADLLVTGEGRFDRGTLEGKVVDFVLSLRPSLPALIVAGSGEHEVLREVRGRRDGRVDLIELPAALQADVGAARAVEIAVGEYLATSF
jgi:glycerate kinase